MSSLIIFVIKTTLRDLSGKKKKVFKANEATAEEIHKLEEENA